jgi:hypothetical protein
VNRAHMAYDHVVFYGFGGCGGVNSQARTSVAVKSSPLRIHGRGA